MIVNLTPEQLAARLEAGDVTLVDVREQGEFDQARIDGAVLLPLSVFDPAAIPQEPGKTVVLYCARGARSANALAVCQQMGLAIDTHLEGGIYAWHAAGLPLVFGA